MARRKSRSKTFKPSVLRRLSEAQNHRCCYCGIHTVTDDDVKAPYRPTIEHIDTRAGDKLHDEANLVMACQRCNNLRANIDALDFFNSRAWAIQDREVALTLTGLMRKRASFVRTGQREILDSMAVMCPLLDKDQRRIAEVNLRRFLNEQKRSDPKVASS